MKNNFVNLYVVFLLCFVAIFYSCSDDDDDIGSGIPNEVAKVDWSEYDNLIEMARFESDMKKRCEILHRAEDILLDSGCVIPYARSGKYYLQREFLDGIFFNPETYYCLRYVRSKNGDKVVKAHICGELENLDFNRNATSYVHVVCGLIFDGLFIIDQKGDYVNGVIESYSLSEDKTHYKFVLKDNLKWSDGSKLDADDFVYTFKRNMAKETGTQMRDLYSMIKGFPDNPEIKSLNNGKVFDVKLAQPCSFFIDLLTGPTFSPLNQKNIESASNYKNDKGVVVNPSSFAKDVGIISNGAFYVDEWEHNSSMVLKKNPYYYDADKIKVDEIHLMLTGDPVAAYSAYKSGNIDFVSLVPPEELSNLVGNQEFHVGKCFRTDYFCFNSKSALFKGMTIEEAKTFRKAIALCMDKEFMVKMMEDPTVSPATSYVPIDISDGDGVYDDNERLIYNVKPDYEEARRLLKSIGYKFNKKGRISPSVTIDYLASVGKTGVFEQCLQADLEQLGITLNIQTKEWAVVLAETFVGKFDFTYLGWSSDYNDVISMLELFHSSHQANATQLGK